MAQSFRFILLGIIIVLLLSACTIGTPPETPAIPTPVPTPVPALELTVSADTSVPFNEVGQVVKYTYQIKNTSGQTLSGPLNLADENRTLECPAINTVGNNDDNLDADEIIACTGTYPITQADLNAGSVTNNATASIGGGSSNAASFKVDLTQNRTLTLSKAANPTVYDRVDQEITYTYVILNSGNVTLQGSFSITDNKVTVECTQPENEQLPPNVEMSCTATYKIVQADLDAGLVTNTASASVGETKSADATTTINKAGSGGQLPAKGTDHQHTVVKGEWLWQIARCYGANPRDVINANNLKWTNPSKILPNITVTVPNVGSVGTIYGSPCIHSYTVVSGDTWASIAEKYKNYNADASLIREANPGSGLVPGDTVRVPVGPYQYP